MCIFELCQGAIPTSVAMDDLHYKYDRVDPLDEQSDLISNKLKYVTDDISNSGYDNDITTQPANNFEYDAIGNLTKDVSEEIDHIDWNVANKITQIERTISSKKDNLYFEYDGLGNRILKKTYPWSGTNQTMKYTWYVRDAQGNILAIYKWNEGDYPALAEVNIYGSSRLGYADLAETKKGKAAQTGFYYLVGKKKYELTNHLGNVTTVVSDRQYPYGDGSSNAISYYSADIISSQEYYPFGSLMPGRESSTDEYRYGFQKQEKDDEIFGSTGTSYTAQFWQYDTRIGRRWNLDPKPNPSISQYAAFNGNPIWFSDILGDTIRGSKSDMASYNSFRGGINTRISNINSQINSLNAKISGTTRQGKINRLNNRIASLNTTLGVLNTTNSELDQLQASTQDYVLNLFNSPISTQGEGGGVTWRANATVGGQPYEDVIMVNINTYGSINQHFAHEFKHAFQYENKQLTFNFSGNNSFTYTNFADEIEAYQREYYFGTINNANGTTVTNPNQITASWVLNRSAASYGYLKGTSSTQLQISNSVLTQMKTYNTQQYTNFKTNFPTGNWQGMGNAIIYKGWKQDAGIK